MSDVRLTAVNPEDSQVYPVACNDKGELVLESATDLDVAVKLDVADTVYADNTGLFVGYGPDDFRNRTIRLNKDGGVQCDGVVQTGGLVTYKRSSVADQNIALFNSDFGSTQSTKFKLTADGKAAFSGQVDCNNLSTGNGVRLNTTGTIEVRNEASGTQPILNAYKGGTASGNSVASILNNGDATFAGGLFSNFISTDTSAGSFNFFKNEGDAGDLNTVYGTIGGAQSVQIYNNGSANFAGPVTAPNITFKFAPALAATMPAPLIDEGFAANNEVDLLSELIKMKLQIRDLNAFMQRTLQEQNETPQ